MVFLLENAQAPLYNNGCLKRCERSSVVEHNLAKVAMRVRFPSLAPSSFDDKSPLSGGLFTTNYSNNYKRYQARSPYRNNRSPDCKSHTLFHITLKHSTLSKIMNLCKSHTLFHITLKQLGDEFLFGDSKSHTLFHITLKPTYQLSPSLSCKSHTLFHITLKRCSLLAC